MRRAAAALLALSLVAVGFPAAVHANPNQPSYSTVPTPEWADPPLTVGDGAVTLNWVREGNYSYVAMVFSRNTSIREGADIDGWCYVLHSNTDSSCTVNGLTNDLGHHVYLWAADPDETGQAGSDNLASAFQAENRYPISQHDYWRGSRVGKWFVPTAPSSMQRSSGAQDGGGGGSDEPPLTAQRATELVQAQVEQAESELPAGPTELSATFTADGDVELSWNAVEDFEWLYEYEIIRWRPLEDGLELRGRPEVYTVTGATRSTWTDPETTWIDDDVEPGGLYSYQVRAASMFNALSQRTEPLMVSVPDPNSGGEIIDVIFVGPLGNEQQTSEPPTSELQQQVTEPPAAPTGLTAQADGDGTISLSWDAPSADDAVTGYEILRRRPREDETTLSTYVADTGSAEASFTDDNATPGTLYVYRIKAINSAGTSSVSNYVNVEHPLAAPTGLTAQANSGGTISLSWDAAPDGHSVTGYEILRRRPREGETTLSTYVADTGSADATWTDSDAPAGTLYVYRIKAINSLGKSAVSSFVKVDRGT